MVVIYNPNCSHTSRQERELNGKLNFDHGIYMRLGTVNLQCIHFNLFFFLPLFFFSLLFFVNVGNNSLLEIYGNKQNNKCCESYDGKIPCGL